MAQYIKDNGVWKRIAGMETPYTKKTIVKTFSGNIRIGGFVTNSGKDYYYTINVPCSNIKQIVINEMKLVVRENNAYIIGTASSFSDVTSNTVVDNYADAYISFRTTTSSAPTGSINNSPVGVACYFSVTIEYEDEIACLALNVDSQILEQLEPVINGKVNTAKTELNNSINTVSNSVTAINKKLGTQVSYSLSGTTLTITTK